jgi:ribosomal protein S18 acetylase RimI-like enzyme
MYDIREMVIADYDRVNELWSKTEGMCLSDADSRPNIELYLNRNKGMSFVCTLDGKIIGTILCGHDGRRGYIYHVAVNTEHRGQSIAKKLIKRSLDMLRSEGIAKCHIMVMADNDIGNQFWSYTGWSNRNETLLYSMNT